MQSFSNQNYKYAGITYTFMAYIHINANNSKTDGNYLNNEDIIQFQYVNSLNSLYLTGELIYVDKYSILDKFFQEPFVYCTISHFEHEYKSDNMFEMEKLSDIFKFQHTFIINNFEIIERSGNVLTYKLKLLGKNWHNCNANLTYTTYNTEKTDIFDILKALIIKSEQKIEKLTFDKIKSDVKIDYITSSNDNLITCFKYLMNKMLYFSEKSESLKFLLFNETTYKYQLFDVLDEEYTNGVVTVTISMFKSKSELQFQQQPINLGSVTKISQKQLFMNLKNNLVFDYNYDENNFVENKFEQKSIVKYMNSKSVSLTEYEDKFYDITSELTFAKYESYWNNTIDIYENTVNILNNGNAIVITVDGNIILKPGSYVIINVDRDDMEFTQTEEIQDLEKTKEKYKNLEGFWIVGKVRHMISASEGIYRQNIVLFKNYKIKKEN